MIVPQSETQIIERLGKYHRTLPSGINIIWPILDKPREMYYRYVETDVNGIQTVARLFGIEAWALAVQLRYDVVTVGIVADGTHNKTFVTEPRGVVCEVGGRTAQALAIPEHVPKDLSHADDVVIFHIHSHGQR